MVIKRILLAATMSSVPVAATASVFNIDQARSFCVACAVEKADSSLSDQQRTAAWMDAWADRGEFPRFLAKLVVTHCDARYRPDLRQVKHCVEDVWDNRGKSGRRIR
jgi:hypothetical protein